MGNFLLVLLALLLVALNGFFVAAEFGLVKLRATRLRSIAKLYGLPGRILILVHKKLDAYLSACQLGITLASLGLGWVGEPAFARLLAPMLAFAGIESPKLIDGIAFVTAFSLISFLHIVVGELAPKSMAIRRTETIAVWSSLPLYGFYWAMYPAIWLLNQSAGIVLKLAGLGDTSNHDAHYSVDELKLILRGAHPDQHINKTEWSVLAHSLDFSELEVCDLMRPFREAISLSSQKSLEENLDLVARNRFSRYPYMDEDGKIAGVIHLKDILLARLQNQPVTDLSQVVRTIQRVPPDMPAMALFRRFREGVSHFAVITGPDDEPLGFITLDNMLGALVGEIRDEFRQGSNDWQMLDDGTLIGKGSLPIFTLERALNIELEEMQVASVGGLVLEKLGTLPEEGDKVEFEQFDIVVKKMQGPRILLLRIYPKKAGEALQA